MDREKMRMQVQRLRNKRVIQKTRVAAPKPKVTKGVVKLQSFSSKKTAPVAPPPANAKSVKASRASTPAQHSQILNSASARQKSKGCGGCKRKMASR